MAEERHIWTEEEVDKLQRMLNTEIKPAEIAEKLNLPVTAVYQKIKYMKQQAKGQAIEKTFSNSEPQAKDKTVEYAKRNSELREKLKQKDEEIKARIAEKNQLRAEMKKISEAKQALVDDLKTANEEISKMKAVLQATEIQLDSPTVKANDSNDELSSVKEFAIIEKIITAILNDMNEDHPSSIYRRIFGSEQPAAENIVDMVTVLNAVQY